LLEYTLPRAPLVGGVVFEVLEKHIAALGPDLIVDQLTRARRIWNHYHDAPGYPPCR
jgi:hypothetical protein